MRDACGAGCTGVSEFLQENAATRMITGATEKEKRQKNYADFAIDYQNLFFLVKPSANIGSHEIVEAKGDVYKIVTSRSEVYRIRLPGQPIFFMM